MRILVTAIAISPTGGSESAVGWNAISALAKRHELCVITATGAEAMLQLALKNGLLPVVLTESQVAELVRRAREIEGYQLTVDLERRIVEDRQGFSAIFAIDDFHRHCLLEGLDDIGLTLQHEDGITAYEKRRPAWMR